VTPMKTPNLLSFGAAAAVLALVLSAASPLEASGLKAAPAAGKDSGERHAGSGTVAAVVADDVECPRIRRKLWVEGEGWIVRRVTLCR
jgi:hypothetical protein